MGKWYREQLSQYYIAHYKRYEPHIAWTKYPSENQYQFYIYSIRKVVTLTCERDGYIRVDEEYR